MTVNKFIETYTEPSLLGEPLHIGTTALRNYIKEHKEKLKEENIVVLIKKISTLRIDIKDPESLYKKLA